jgi:dipeptidyl aminopeptidase/acylaminoacyl peptidase
MGITGNSYGGIMTMGAVAHAPLVFQAAAAQSGYANWISFQDYNTELQHTKLLAYEWGPYPDSAAVYRRNSSIFSAEHVMAPVLLIFGTGQTQAWRPGVYPIPAALEFAHALDRSNKVVKVKTYAGESDYVTGRENSKQVLLDLLEWFDQYLRDGVRAPDRAATGGGSR